MGRGSHTGEQSGVGNAPPNRKSNWLATVAANSLFRRVCRVTSAAGSGSGEALKVASPSRTNPRAVWNPLLMKLLLSGESGSGDALARGLA